MEERALRRAGGSRPGRGVDRGHGAPPPIAKQFSGTFLDTIPGVDAAWTILGILESLIFILVVVSLVRLEFLPGRHKSFLLIALGLAVFTFSILAMGQNVVGENEGVAELFTYAGATGVLIFLVLLMPPYRAGDWVSRVRGDTGDRHGPATPD